MREGTRLRKRELKSCWYSLDMLPKRSLAFGHYLLLVRRILLAARASGGAIGGITKYPLISIVVYLLLSHDGQRRG
jgi:hypothetical protein